MSRWIVGWTETSPWRPQWSRAKERTRHCCLSLTRSFSCFPCGIYREKRLLLLLLFFLVSWSKHQPSRQVGSRLVWKWPLRQQPPPPPPLHRTPLTVFLFSPLRELLHPRCVWWLLLPSYRNRINSRLPRDGAPVDSHILNPHNKHKRDKFKGLLFRRQSLPLIQISCWKKREREGDMHDISIVPQRRIDSRGC